MPRTRFDRIEHLISESGQLWIAHVGLSDEFIKLLGRRRRCSRLTSTAHVLHIVSAFLGMNFAFKIMCFRRPRLHARADDTQTHRTAPRFLYLSPRNHRSSPTMKLTHIEYEEKSTLQTRPGRLTLRTSPDRPPSSAKRVKRTKRAKRAERVPPGPAPAASGSDVTLGLR